MDTGIKVSNVRFYEGLPFRDYLGISRISFSSLKAAGRDKPFEETDKMRFGTCVHNILLEPSKVGTPLPGARAVAIRLKQSLGNLVNLMKPELTVTADFEHQGLILKWKGRVDLGAPGKFVVDIKVTEMSVKKAIEFFRYDRQQTGYMLGIGAKYAIIAGVHPKKELPPDVEIIHPDYGFWRETIIKYGEPAK